MQLTGIFFLAYGLLWKKIYAKNDGLVYVKGMGNIVTMKQKIPYDHIRAIAENKEPRIIRSYAIIIYPPREKSGTLNTDYSLIFSDEQIDDERKLTANVDERISWDRFRELEKIAVKGDPEIVFKDM